MPIVITYDVTDGKQDEFKNWLKDNKGWLDSEQKSNGLKYPESTLVKAGTQNGNNDVLQAKQDMEQAAKSVRTEIERALIVSTQGALDVFSHTPHFSKLFK